MLFRSAFACTAAAAAATLALTSAVSSAPVTEAPQHQHQRRQQSQCQSLGHGPLGFNSSGIGIYSKDPPSTYLEAQDGQIVATTDAPYNGTFFEFIQCNYDPPAYQGKGAIDTYQGYIKAPDGSCLSVDSLTGQDVAIKTEPCDFSGNQYYGGVKDNQHFQFQLDSFFSYYSVVFLGSVPGPANASDFGAGGNYHFSLSDSGVLDVSYLADQPQTGNGGEQLIAQLNGQYVSQKVMSPCKLVKSGPVELVDRQTGQTQSAYAGDSRPNASQFSKRQLLFNGTTTSPDTFSFYQCDSTYMGFQSDDTNYYGHFTSDVPGETGCYTVDQESIITGSLVNLSGSGYNSTSPDSGCGINDGNVQFSSFFHLTNNNGNYEINFLGYTTAEPAQQYSFGLDQDAQDSLQQFLVLNQTSTQYTLRFVD